MINILKQINFLINFNKNKKIIFFQIAQVFFEVFSVALIFGVSISIFTDFDTNIYLKKFINTDLNSIQLLLLLIVVYFIKSILAICIQYILISYKYSLLHDLRLKFAKNIFDMDYSSFLKKKETFYFDLLTRQINLFINSIYIPLLKFIGDSFLLIIFIITVIVINPILTLFLILIFAIIFFAYDQKFKEKFNNKGKSLLVNSIHLAAHLRDSVQGYIQIKINSGQDYILSLISTHSNLIKKAQIYPESISTSINYIIDFIVVGILITILSVSTLLKLETEIVLPFIISGTYITLKFSQLFKSFIGITSAIRKETKVIDNLYIFFQKDNLRSKKTITDFNQISLNNISFKFNNQKKHILKNINIEINKSSLIGIKGKSGSGKTTLLNLIMGIYRPTAGKIYINNKIDTKDIDLKNLYGYLPQHTLLLKDTFEKNITFSNKKINKPKLIKVLKSANIFDEYNYRNKTLNEIFDVNINNLSGGQIQRFGLARALYKNKKIIILDEPTNNLDAKNKNLLIKLIKKLSKQHTIIISSHDPDIFNICDKVYEIKSSLIYEKK